MLNLFIDSVLRGATTLVFPPNCMNCGLPGVDICSECKKVLTPKPRFLLGEEFPLVSSLFYGEATGKLMLLAKENGYVAAQKFFATALAISINYFNLNYPISIVPIPSQRKAIRRRGFDSMKEIARFVLRDPNLKTKFEIVNLLEITRHVADQSSLSERERYQNLDKAFRVKSGIKSKAIIVIDDVVTTGSTLREAVRALKERNLTVLGAATACATQRRLAIG